jgi:hypothetical protein
VTVVLDIVTSALPTTACSKAVPRLVLVVLPHVPACSPVPISSIFRLVEYVLAMFFPLSCYSDPIGGLAVINVNPVGVLKYRCGAY